MLWPDTLEHPVLGRHINNCRTYNQPFYEVAWPASLTRLTFGSIFNTNIAGFVWPVSLQCLTFGSKLNQLIANVVWPPSLLSLAFGEEFDQPVQRVVWPVSLLYLAFGSMFDNPIDTVAWPLSLISLKFDSSSDGPIQGVVLAHYWGGKKLWPGSTFHEPTPGTIWPASLQHLAVRDKWTRPPHQIVWPTTLLFLDVWPQLQSAYQQR